MSEALIIHPEKAQHKVSFPKVIDKTTLTSWSSLPDYSLMNWIAEYLRTEVYGVQSPHTLQAKARDLFGFANWFLAFNGHGNIEDWWPRDTQTFLSHLEQQGKAATTINRVFASMRRFARWAHEQPNSPFRHGLPTRGIKELAVDEPDCKKLSTRELHRLFKAADNLVLVERRKNARPRRNRAILALLYFTGMRVSELSALLISQYHDKYLHEVRRKGKSRTKALYLSTACRAVLDEYISVERATDDARGEKTPLFLSSSGDGYLRREQIFRLMNHIGDEANKHSQDNLIDIHPHRLRHTFGAEFRDKTGSDTETQQALGHVSLKYVGRYVRKTQEERETVMESIGSLSPDASTAK